MKLSKVFSFFLIYFYLYSANIVYGQGIGLNIKQQPGGLNLTSDDPSKPLKYLIQNTITIFFSIGAIGFVIMFLWAAVNWILSGGDKEKIAGARKRITTAIVGLALLSLTFVAMVILGQIFSIDALQYGEFYIPGLLDPPKK